MPGWLKTETALKAKGKSSFRGKILAKALGKKIHGGCVRLMISGAAPLPVHVQQFLLAAMGCAVVQGYGMTENCANATLADLRDYRAGHVGPPMPTVEVKLVDVPEMEYTTAKNSCGEVCTRGAVNFSGYYKNQEETDKVLDADGWLHTGDIGRWNPDGTLSIIDRKKNIFKLSQGEYVAAEKIEMIVSKSKYATPRIPHCLSSSPASPRLPSSSSPTPSPTLLLLSLLPPPPSHALCSPLPLHPPSAPQVRWPAVDLRELIPADARGGGDARLRLSQRGGGGGWMGV